MKKNNSKAVGKVALLSETYPPTIDGVANVVVNYAKALEKNHNGAVVITTNKPNHDGINSPSPIIEYPSIDTSKRYVYPTGIPFSPKVCSYLHKNPVDILHSHSPAVSTILGQRLSKLYSIPLVLTYHTRFELEQKAAPITKLESSIFSKSILKNTNACDEVWTVGKAAEDSLRFYGYEGNVVRMPNGIDLPRGCVSEEQVHSVCDKVKLNPNAYTMLFVGRLIHEKGVPEILKALAILDAQNIDFNMVFIGDGRDLEYSKKLARKLHIADKCHFLGMIHDREELRAWYTRADLFLFPSLYDTMGLVVREAAAAGTPSILIEGSSTAEGVIDGYSGFLTDNSIEALAAKIKQVLENPEIIHTVGANAANELYLSWDDAVAMAYERYAYVIERFKATNPELIRQKRQPLIYSQAKLMSGLSHFVKVF